MEMTFRILHKKMTNIVSAIILVIKSIKDNDEISDKIKTLSLDAIKTLSNFDHDSFDPKKTFLDLQKILLQIKSLIDILVVIDLISSSNKDILNREIDLFIDDFTKFIGFTNEGYRNNIKSIFMLDQKEIIRDNISKTKNNENKYEEGVSKIQKDKNLYVDTGLNNRKKNRQNSILEFVIKHKDVSIKDILPNIKGCSEKTIQRELISLIASQKIKRIGDRRWARYTVA